MIILLSDLPDGINATVHSVCVNDHFLNEDHLRRLGELGFLPGEPVQVVRRGPGDREPLAVVVGDSLFALRLAEARCISVVVSD